MQEVNNYNSETLYTPRAHRILVIDDDDSILSLLGHIFKDINAIVYKAHDPGEGYRYFAHKQIDLCFIDINIDEFNGFELAKIFRRRNVFETPIVFISSDGEMIRDFYQSEIFNSYFLPKPLSKKKVMNATEQVAPFMVG